MQSLSTNLPLIRLSSVNPFLMELNRRNLDGGAILRKMGLPGQVPASSDLFASALTIYEIVEESAAVAKDPQIGLNLGKNLDIARWDPIARAAADAVTIGDLLRYFVVNALEHSSSTKFYLRTEGDRTTFGFERVVEPSITPAQNDAFYLGIFCKVLREATGPFWEATEVLAAVSDPSIIPSESGMPRILKGGRDGFSISFPTTWQFEKIQKSGFRVAPADAPDNVMPGSLVDAVRQALAPHIHDSSLDVARAADICGYSKRQLSRRLKEQGTTIISEIVRLKSDIACDQLVNSKTRVAEIGESVGFQDPTVFSRAFKNWTGQSPQQYRTINRAL